jgi:hypothetical protein
LPTLQAVVPKARIASSRTIQNIEITAIEKPSSIPAAQATNVTAQVMVLVDHMAADIAPQ